jgi:hypothetical protein
MEPKRHDFPGYSAVTYFSDAFKGLSDKEKGEILGRIDKTVSAKVDSLASKTLQSKPETEEKEVDMYDMLLKGEDVTGQPKKADAPLISYLIEQTNFSITFQNADRVVLARTNVNKKE